MTAAVLCSLQPSTTEPINGSTVRNLYKYGIVQVDVDDAVGIASLRMSKMLVRAVLRKRHPKNADDWHNGNPPLSAYIPPDEILRTIRRHDEDMQELVHVWSFAINFNALASLTAPTPRSITMATLRPGVSTLLEPEGAASMLHEELHVPRDENNKPKSWLRVMNRKVVNDKVKDDRVALHDIVNQAAFTSGLTMGSSKGVDGWARIGDDVVVLFQTKGRDLQSETDNTFSPKELHGHIESLMTSSYEAVDNHLAAAIRRFAKRGAKDGAGDARKHLVSPSETCR